jgi:hypothetical protein
MSATEKPVAAESSEATGSGLSAQQRSQAFEGARQAQGFPSWRIDHRPQTDPTLSYSRRDLTVGIFAQIPRHTPVPPQSVLPSNAHLPSSPSLSASLVTPRLVNSPDAGHIAQAADSGQRPLLHDPLSIRSLTDPATVRSHCAAPPAGHWNPFSAAMPGGDSNWSPRAPASEASNNDALSVSASQDGFDPQQIQAMARHPPPGASVYPPNAAVSSAMNPRSCVTCRRRKVCNNCHLAQTFWRGRC